MHKPTLLIDMDQILVDMVDVWLRSYQNLTGEILTQENIIEYEFDKMVKFPKLLNSLIESPGFFLNLPPMPGAEEYFVKLLKCGKFDVIVVTQPPRRSDYAIKDKKEWLSYYFNFHPTNIIFTHKKYLIRGDVLFDDKPSHLEDWKKHNPTGKTFMINYPYNTKAVVDFAFNKETAWKDFHESVNSIF